MKYLKQRVPLGTLQGDGKTVQITREFGDDIEKLMSGDAVPADLTALVIRISALEADNKKLNARVKALEGGYQV